MKNRFVLLWVCSATIITFARAFHAADLGYDPTIQIQAAQNFLAGRGLSIYSTAAAADLAKPNPLLTLTAFPSGYSFCAAALLGLGLSVGSVLKVGGVAGTMLGWWGWGRLAYSFFSEGLKRGRAWRWAASAIAICTPLLFTPSWRGTDIFLWAAIPWVLEWVVKGSDENLPRRLWFDFLAGALCGFCVWMRYASLFLPGYAGLLILFQVKGDIKVTARRWAAFVVGLTPLIILQAYLNYFVSAVEATPGGFAPSGRPGISQVFWSTVWSLPAANYTLVWWMPRKVHELFVSSAEQKWWLLAITPLLFAMPVVVAMKSGYREVAAALRDIRTAAAGLFVVLPMFLCACAMLGLAYVRVTRYYMPLLPLALLIAYMLAAAEWRQENKMRAFWRLLSLGYLVGYLGMAAAGVILLVSPGEKGHGRRATFLSASKICTWPSTGLIYEFSASRKYVLDLLKAEPGTILVTNLEEWFYADPSVDLSRVHRLRALEATYISGPARVLILAKDPFEAPADALYWFDWNRAEGMPRPATYFDGIPIQLLRRFPSENVKILEFRVPNGSQLALKHVEPADL